MAVQVTQKLVCDFCGGEDDVRRYRITRLDKDRRTISPDLCAKDSEMIEALYSNLPTGKRGQTRSRQVLTEAQIAAKRRRT